MGYKYGKIAQKDLFKFCQTVKSGDSVNCGHARAIFLYWNVFNLPA